MNFLEKKEETIHRIDTQNLEKVVHHIDHVLQQFRLRIVHTPVKNPLTEFSKQGLTDLREIDHNHWLRCMNSYFLRLKSYFMEGTFFVGPLRLNEYIHFYERELINIKNSSMDDYEHTILYLFNAFSKNSRK